MPAPFNQALLSHGCQQIHRAMISSFADFADFDNVKMFAGLLWTIATFCKVLTSSYW